MVAVVRLVGAIHRWSVLLYRLVVDLHDVFSSVLGYACQRVLPASQLWLSLFGSDALVGFLV